MRTSTQSGVARSLKWWILLALLPLVPLQCGGLSCGPNEDPCDQDRQGCAESPGLVINATCAAEPVLSAEVGAGDGAFQPLSPGQIPELHYGSQGGVHMLVGARVQGAQLDRYDRLEFTFAIQSPCPECPGGFSDAETRTALVGPPLRAEGAVVTEPGFLLFADALEYERERPHRLRLVVRDPCGRQAEAVHLMASMDGRLDLGLPDAAPADAAPVTDAGGRDAGVDGGR